MALRQQFGHTRLAFAALTLLPAAVCAPAAAATNSSCAKILNDTALGGRNVKDYVDKTMNVSRCCAFCDSLPDCVGWTLDARNFHCYAKDKVDKPKSTRGMGSISATRPGAKPAGPEPVPGPPKVHPVPGDHPVAPPPGAKNVLFLICDDMRPQLGAYGHAFMHTPHIDHLAATGTLFTRAYVQYSFCAPSRNSFMTGRRPDATKVWNFLDNFRRGTSDGDTAGMPTDPVGADWTTLPGNFKRNGYFVTGTGKTFHPGDPYQFDYPYSWSFDEFPYGFGGGPTKGHPDWKNTTSDHIWCNNTWNASAESSVVCAGGEVGCPDAIKIEGEAFWCSIDTSKLPMLPDGTQQKLWDQAEVDLAKERLQYAAKLQQEAEAAGKPKRPFFVAVGFHRPHLPWFAPKEFYDLYPPAETMPGPTHPEVPIGMPGVAWHGSGPAEISIDKPAPMNYTLRARRGLYATMSYVDSLVGDVLAELDALGLTNDTVVSFVGDHGQQVGEHNLWEKMTNFELGVRIPMIIRAPWLAGSIGRRSEAMAEIVDLYKTLADLTGVPLPTDNSQPVMGRSLKPAMAGGLHPNNYSFSQFAKTGKSVDAAFGTCMGCHPSGSGAADFMGFSVRSVDFRWTEWFVYDKEKGAPMWDKDPAAAELYDHRGDLGDGRAFDDFENENLANSTEAGLAAARAELRAVLRAQFQHDDGR